MGDPVVTPGTEMEGNINQRLGTFKNKIHLFLLNIEIEFKGYQEIMLKCIRLSGYQ